MSHKMTSTYKPYNNEVLNLVRLLTGGSIGIILTVKVPRPLQ